MKQPHKADPETAATTATNVLGEVFVGQGYGELSASNAE